MIRRLFYIAAFLLCGLLLAGWAAYLKLDRTPGELIRYTERRLEGHPKLEALALPVLHAIRTRVEIPVNLETLPTFGKGVRANGLLPQQYDEQGSPLASLAAQTNIDMSTAMPPTPTRLPGTAEELKSAVLQARAGDVLEIRPGTYAIKGSLKTAANGTATQPIVLRAARAGSVILEFTTVESMRIAHSYWQVENLTLRGRCRSDSDCEHAFHIFGPAQHVVIRNNLLEDYNAPIKINGLNGSWPDGGLIQHNTLANSRRRNTHLPVTMIDIVGASQWTIADNIISNFIKGDGNRVAYGAFMKGGGSNGRIERNLVICTPRDISQPGTRIGLSMGGGGTEKKYCRDQRCDTEHSNGLVANNVVAHCNDFGLDVNTSNQTVLAHNTLINTSGIDVRQAMSSATVYGNLLDGRIRARNGALLEASENTVGNLFAHPARLDLKWRQAPSGIATYRGIGNDFCGRPRQAHSLPGAFADIGNCPARLH